jgi:hypothetical protein
VWTSIHGTNPSYIRTQCNTTSFVFNRIILPRVCRAWSDGTIFRRSRCTAVLQHNDATRCWTVRHSTVYFLVPYYVVHGPQRHTQHRLFKFIQLDVRRAIIIIRWSSCESHYGSFCQSTADCKTALSSFPTGILSLRRALFAGICWAV